MPEYSETAGHRPDSRTRRSFLRIAAAAGTAGLTACDSPPAKQKEVDKRPRRILVRSGWRQDDLGDLASTAGLLRLVESNIPRAEITLWTGALDPASQAMLAANFPAVKLAGADVDFASADFLLYGSGPVEAARTDIDAWRKGGAKPYGFLGIGVEQSAIAQIRDLLDGAAFVFTRERASLDNLQKAGLPGARIAYAPDGAFSLKLGNEAAAKTLLAGNGLEPKKFIAVVPRQAGIATLRDVIVPWVRTTGNKVLLCPETRSELQVLESLRASLPAEVKARVMRLKSFWLPDAASSVYRRALAVVSAEYYSPIIAAVNDTPCLYLGDPQEGNAGQIWDDVGLKRWYFDAGQAKGEQMWQALKSISEHYAGVQVDVHEAVIGARRLQSAAMDRLQRTLAAS